MGPVPKRECGRIKRKKSVAAEYRKDHAGGHEGDGLTLRDQGQIDGCAIGGINAVESEAAAGGWDARLHLFAEERLNELAL
jgi:hypothetical protein